MLLIRFNNILSYKITNHLKENNMWFLYTAAVAFHKYFDCKS